MSSTTTSFSEPLQKFAFEYAVSETEYLERLREETASHPMAVMQIAPLQGALMSLIIKAMGAKEVLEIGTFTGYSSLVMAEAVGSEGRVVTCDLSDDYTRIARRFWSDAGLADRIDLRLGNAADTLASMLDNGMRDSFDLAFIDADKEQYPTYYEQSLALVRRAGVVLIDNMFMDGRVADPDNREEGVLAVRRLYDIMRADERIEFTVIPVADGLGMAVKR